MSAPQKRRKSHQYEEMLPEEFYRELKRAPIAYFTCSGLEAHGPHNALGIDSFIPYFISLKAAWISGGIVFPPTFISVPYLPGLTWKELKNTKKELYPPSFWHSRELLEKLYKETIWNFERLGFLVCMAIPGHLPNTKSMFSFCERINYRYGRMIVYPVRISDSEFLKDYKLEECGHGGIWESSVLKALAPHLVEPSKIETFLKGKRGHIPPDAKLQWSPSNIKNPYQITEKKGRPYVKLIVETIAKKATELLKKQIKGK